MALCVGLRMTVLACDCARLIFPHSPPPSLSPPLNPPPSPPCPSPLPLSPSPSPQATIVRAVASKHPPVHCR
jgi:hypothetical protein